MGVIEELVRRVAYLERRCARLEAADRYGRNIVTPGDGRFAGGLYVGDSTLDPVLGTIVATKDMYPRAIKWGLSDRLINPLVSVTDHFQTGSIPTGYSWAPVSGVMYGTPSSLDYSWKGDYLYTRADANGKRHLLYKSVANEAAAWQGRTCYARVRTGAVTEVGIRFDNGNSASDQPFVELGLRGNTDGSSSLVFRYQNAVGGGITEAVLASKWQWDEFVGIRLLCSTEYRFYSYLLPEDGSVIFVSTLQTGPVAWVPCAGRVGLYVKDRDHWALVDWFYSNF